MGRYIDAKDSSNHWCTARVVDLDSTSLLLHLDGWSAKWDERVSLKSSRLAPFRRYSSAGQGVPVSPVREEWVFSVQEVVSVQGRVRLLCESEMQVGSAYEATQFLRGELFVLVDCLLTRSFQPAEVHTVLQFLASVIDLVLCYLQLPEVYTHLSAGQATPELYLTDTNVAVALAYSDLITTLERVMGGEERTSRFFKTHNEAPRDYEPGPETIWNRQYSRSLLYLGSYFAKKGGFRVLLDLVSRSEPRVPLEVLARFPVFLFTRFLQPKALFSFIQEWKSALLARLNSLSERDLKDLSKDLTQRLLSSLQSVLQQSDKSAGPEVAEELEMKLALQLLRAQALERRLRGLNDFRELIQRMQPRAGGKKMAKQRLVAYMQEQNLLYTLIADRPHAELLRRSADLFVFMAEARLLTTAHIDVLWLSCSDKHESYVRAVHEVIIAVAPFLHSDLKDTVFQHFSEISSEQYDEKFLKLMKDFSINAMLGNKSNDATNDFALPKFFSLMLDDPKTPSDLADLSADLLLEILRSTAFKNRQEEYLDLVLDNVVRRRESVPQSLRIALGLLKPQSAGLVPRALSEQLKKLERRFGLLSAIVESLIQYQRVARTFPSPGPEMVVSGRYSHSINISIRLSFLQFLLEANEKARLLPEQLSALWDAFMTAPSCQWDSDTYAGWLASNVDTGLGKDLVELIFERWLCGPVFVAKDMSIAGFDCFVKYFLYVNSAKRRLDARGSSILQRLHADVIGLSALSEVVFVAEKDQITSQATRLLITLYLRLGKSALADKDRLWSDFLTKAVTRLRSKAPLSRALRLLEGCLDLAEGKEAHPSKAGNPIQVFYRLVSDSEYRRCQMTTKDNLSDVRRRLCDVLRYPPSFLQLYIQDKAYTRLDDDLELGLFKPPITVVLEVRATTDLVDPKPLMVAHPDLMDCLFDLLAQQPEAADQVWSLLMRFPLSEKLKKALLAPDWPRLLDTHSQHRLLYSLLALDELSSLPEFIVGASGLEALLRVFLTCRPGSDLVLRFALVMFRLIRKFLRTPPAESAQVTVQTLELLLELSTNQDAQAAEALRLASDILLVVCEEGHILSFRHLGDLLSASLLGGTQQFREGMKSLMRALCRKLALETPITLELFELLPRALLGADSGCAYFHLTAKLLKKAEIEDSKLTEVQQFLLVELQEHRCERSASDHDEVLSGILTTLKAVTERQAADCQLLPLVLHSCLFEIPLTRQATEGPPKCKHPVTRKAALKLLAQLTCEGEGLSAVLGRLEKLHEEPQWRGSRKQDWSLHPAAQERSQTGFGGVKNLGCTCYLGSILQQLFTVDTFRSGILAIQAQESDLLYKLQSVFAVLQDSDKASVSPKELAESIRQPFNPMEQMDVDEFFTHFLDRLETLLAPNTLVQDHFGGLQTTALIGKGTCSHLSFRTEPFLVLPLELKNKRSLNQSLDTLIQGEVLEGDNAYQCDLCAARVTAERRVYIQHLPNIMVFALRRFDFDLDTMSRRKLNDYCEFPMEIDLLEYTAEGLNLKGKGETCPAEYYQYRLRGVVVHSGTAESGHYYSFIGTERGWVEFNDTLVREFDLKDLPIEAFGGEERTRNAYLLFYQRSVMYQRRPTDEDALLPLDFGFPAPSSGVAELCAQVRVANQQFWSRKNAFCPEFFEFLLRLCAFHEDNLSVGKFVVRCYLTVFLRARDKHRSQELFAAVRKALEGSRELRVWVLELVSVEPVVREFLLDCPEAPMRRLVVTLVTDALKDTEPEELRILLVRLLGSLSKAAKPHSRCFAHYFQLLDVVTERSPETAQDLQLPLRLLVHLFDLPVPALPSAPAYTHCDISLGYQPDSIPAASDRFPATESGTQYTYLYSVLAHCHLDEDCKAILTTKGRLAWMLKDANTRVASRALGVVLARLCTDDLTLFGDICKVVCSLLCSESEQATALLRVMSAVLGTKDVQSVYRVEAGLTAFLALLKDNLASVRVTETLLDFLYSLVGRDPAMQAALKQQDMKFLEDWVRRVSGFTYTYQNLYKSKATPEPRPSPEKLEKARQLLRYEFQVAPDLDRVVRAGERVEVGNSAFLRWDAGVVLQSLGEVVQVKLDADKAGMWVEADSDLVVLERTRRQ